MAPSDREERTGNDPGVEIKEMSSCIGQRRQDTSNGMVRSVCWEILQATAKWGPYVYIEVFWLCLYVTSFYL